MQLWSMLCNSVMPVRLLTPKLLWWCCLMLTGYSRLPWNCTGKSHPSWPFLVYSFHFLFSLCCILPYNIYFNRTFHCCLLSQQWIIGNIYIVKAHVRHVHYWPGDTLCSFLHFWHLTGYTCDCMWCSCAFQACGLHMLQPAEKPPVHSSKPCSCVCLICMM